MIRFKDKDGNVIIHIFDIDVISEYTTTFKVNVFFQDFYGKISVDTDAGDLNRLAKQLKKMYEFKYKEILFETRSSDLKIHFLLTETYHIQIRVNLSDSDNPVELMCKYTTDQTLLNETLIDLNSIDINS